MSRPCPDHPGRTGNELPECRWCVQEAALADHTQGAAAVRAQLANAPRPTRPATPTEPARDLARARARTDKETRR